MTTGRKHLHHEFTWKCRDEYALPFVIDAVVIVLNLMWCHTLYLMYVDHLTRFISVVVAPPTYATCCLAFSHYYFEEEKPQMYLMKSKSRWPPDLLSSPFLTYSFVLFFLQLFFYCLSGFPIVLYHWCFCSSSTASWIFFKFSSKVCMMCLPDVTSLRLSRHWLEFMILLKKKSVSISSFSFDVCTEPLI